MKCTDHLRLLAEPNEEDREKLAFIEKQARESISSETIIEEFVRQILGLFWNCYEKDRDVFIKDVLFQNQLVLRATKANQEYVFDHFEKAKAEPEGQHKQIQLVNIYRNMVSDIFEPYLSILIACLQMKEDKFTSFDTANLGASEFHKYEFAYARMKPTNLFNGYILLIRNTASHTGSHSIRYEGNTIIFNKIKRQARPVIDDILIISTERLISYIQDLMDFTQCIDVSINIMGMDIGDIIWNSPSLAQEFSNVLITREQLIARRKENDQNHGQVWNDERLTFTDKFEHFRKLYIEGCHKNEMPLAFIRMEGKFLIILIPWKKLLGNELKYMANRVAELYQYAALAEMYFYYQFTDYIVEEILEPGEDCLQVWQKREDLNLYNEGNAHMLDLIQDGKAYQNYTYQPLHVNFELLDKASLHSLKLPRKRKDRSNSNSS